MNFPAAAMQSFKILRSHNYECTLYDDEGNQVFEPEDARRFASKKNNLMLGIIDDGDKSQIRLLFRKDTPVETLNGMMQSLRVIATKYNMTFSTHGEDKNIYPKDFATKISMTEASTLTEGMYGTSRSSYLRLENARMIVRHSAKINEDMMGARGRNIDSIYIEDKQGQRMLFPTKQLAPARAMAHHVSNGGEWSDEGGEAISRLAKDYADLREASRHIYQNSGTLSEEAGTLREHVRDGMRGLRKTFEAICRKTRYEDVMQSLKKPLVEDQGLAEGAHRVKKTMHVEGIDLEERVYETTARIVKEVEAEKLENSMTTFLGVKLLKATWDRFKNGELDLAEHLHAPHGADGYRAYNALAMKQIGTACKDPAMGELFAKLGEKFESSEMSKAMKAVAAKALSIVGWEVPKTIAASEPVKELGEWIDGHRVEAVDEHCGHCPEDREEDAKDELEEEDAYLTQGIAPDENDLTLDDIIIPTNQGESLKDEVTVNTVIDPETGEEELPSTEYLSRMRSLSGLNSPMAGRLY